MKSKKIYGVLVVDDSEDDRLSLRNTLKQFPRFKLVHELCDGEAAVDYLTGRDRYHERDACPLPDLVLLDLDMPGMGGFGFLRWLRTQSFPSLTVIVLSNSALPEVMLLSVALGAHGYWSKPASPEMRRLMLLEIEIARWACSLVSENASQEGGQVKSDEYPFPSQTVNTATSYEVLREAGTDELLPGVNAEAVPNPLALIIGDESKNRRLLGICLSSLLKNSCFCRSRRAEAQISSAFEGEIRDSLPRLLLCRVEEWRGDV